MFIHVSNTSEAINHGGAVDKVFQSIAGTEAANRSFGIYFNLLFEADIAAWFMARGSVANNVM